MGSNYCFKIKSRNKRVKVYTYAEVKDTRLNEIKRLF